MTEVNNMNCKRCKKELTNDEMFESRQVESFEKTQIRELYECIDCGKINVMRIEV